MEQMKPIPNFPGYFADEKLGNIFSMKPNGAIGTKPPTEPRRLKPMKSRGGYLHVSLMKDGKKFTRLVHHLVLETFVGPRPRGMQSCHNNGVRTDSRPENLRWDTPNEKNGLSKLNEMQVRIIRQYFLLDNTYGRFAYLAKIFKVSKEAIGQIASRKIWWHV
jgi:hypothetical protein